MKIISFIFAILLFGISALPCSDGVSAESEIHMHASDADDDNSHSDHEDHSDGCSPFCICSCCGVSLTVPTVVDSECLLFTDNVEHAVHCLTDNSNAYPNSVWHPPTFC